MQSKEVGLVEIFGVVADPATGKTIRIHETTARQHADAEAFGQHAADKLLQAGARDLLNLPAAPPPGAAD